MESLIERGLSRPWHELRLPAPLEARYHAETGPESGRFVQSWLAVFIVFNVLSLKTDHDAFSAEAMVVPLVLTLGVFVPVAVAAIIALRGRPSPLRLTLAALATALTDMAIVLNSARLVAPEHTNTYLILAAIVPLVVGLIAPMPFRHSLWFCGSAFVLYVSGVVGLGFTASHQIGVPLLVASLTLVPTKMSYSREWEAKRSFLLGLRERIRAGELARANARLIALSQTDPLTGVANRRLFVERLNAVWAGACAEESWVGVVLFDLDHFKLLNDAAGHGEGDRCLRLAARALSDVVTSAGGVMARYGGEEFAALLPHRDLAASREMAEAARGAVADLAVPHPGLPAGGILTVSAGVAAGRGDGQSRDADAAILLKRADDALYVAKRAGRNRVETLPARPAA
ncbi:GGDEF domain-containing protein [Methylobacterium sp. ID0610]|uniref:GGDEF domain-containing protein n=1 Tax=Methylobacterium carpenticola TaxID=3344827 RepID=UPI0036A0A37F